MLYAVVFLFEVLFVAESAPWFFCLVAFCFVFLYGLLCLLVCGVGFGDVLDSSLEVLLG